MSNSFKTLDDFFPCGKERLSGEVVSISVSISVNGRFTSVIGWKRKQWYVNASVNAWHLHRCLCREFRETGLKFTGAKGKKTKAFLLNAVMYSYLRNYATDNQYFEFELELGNEDPVGRVRAEPSLDAQSVLPLFDKFSDEQVKDAFFSACWKQFSLHVPGFVVDPLKI